MGFIVDRYSVSVAVPLHIIVPRLYEEKRPNVCPYQISSNYLKQYGS